MKKLFIIPLILSLILSGCSDLSILKKTSKTYKKEGQKKLSITTSNTVRIDADNSNIIIRQNNSNQIIVEYTKKVIANKITNNQLDELFDEMSIELENTADNKEIQLKSRAYLSEAITNMKASNVKRSIDLNIFIPKKCKVILQNGNGNILVKNLGNNLYIVNGNGNIDIKEIIGSYDIRNGSGNIKVDYSKGNAFINNGNGNIDVNITQAKKISIINNNGNITARIDKLNSFEKSLIQGGNGNIKLSFTKEVSSKVSIKTSSKSMKSDFELKKQNDTYTANIYGNNHQLDVILGSGTVELNKE